MAESFDSCRHSVTRTHMNGHRDIETLCFGKKRMEVRVVEVFTRRGVCRRRHRHKTKLLHTAAHLFHGSRGVLDGHQRNALEPVRIRFAVPRQPVVVDL